MLVVPSGMAKCTPSPDGDDAAVAIALVFYTQDTKHFLSAVLNNLAPSSFGRQSCKSTQWNYHVHGSALKDRRCMFGKERAVDESAGDERVELNAVRFGQMEIKIMEKCHTIFSKKEQRTPCAQAVETGYAGRTPMHPTVVMNGYCYVGERLHVGAGTK